MYVVMFFCRKKIIGRPDMQKTLETYTWHIFIFNYWIISQEIWYDRVCTSQILCTGEQTQNVQRNLLNETKIIKA